jgi:uncharacterized membrane protein
MIDSLKHPENQWWRQPSRAHGLTGSHSSFIIPRTITIDASLDASKQSGRTRGRHMVATPFTVFVVSTLIIVAVFAVVALSRTPGARRLCQGQPAALLVLAALGAILVTFLVLTLSHLPYAVDARAPTGSSAPSATARGR